MKVKDIRKLIEDSIYPDQTIIIEDDWAIFVDTSTYDSDICAEDTVKYIYVDECGRLHIHI